MRDLVVDEMSRDRDSYMGHIGVDQRDAYLDNMRRPFVYVDEAELVALSKVYGVAIHVWGADAAHDRERRAPGVGDDAPVVHLAHRDAGDARDHFWAVDFPARGQVRSRSIMLCLRASLRRVLARGSRCCIAGESREKRAP